MHVTWWMPSSGTTASCRSVLWAAKTAAVPVSGVANPPQIHNQRRLVASPSPARRPSSRVVPPPRVGSRPAALDADATARRRACVFRVDANFGESLWPARRLSSAGGCSGPSAGHDRWLVAVASAGRGWAFGALTALRTNPGAALRDDGDQRAVRSRLRVARPPARDTTEAVSGRAPRPLRLPPARTFSSLRNAARPPVASIANVDCDVAVIGGGPGGYTAAIRAAQLGARTVCVEREPELGGTCLRIGCIPTKAWVQTAHFLHQARESFPKLGVTVGEPQLDFARANDWKAAVVRQMTTGVAQLFKANGVEWVRGAAALKDANTLTVDRGAAEDISFKQAILATGSFPIRPPIEGLESARVVDSPGLLAQTEVPRRLLVLGGGIIGCEFASIFRTFGSEVTIVELLPRLIPQEDEDAATELTKAFTKRGITLHLGKQCSKVEQRDNVLTVHFGDGEQANADLMLVSVGRAPAVENLGLEAVGIDFDKRKGIAADEHRRTTVPHIYAVGDCAGYWQLAHTAFREGEVAAENATGHDAVVDNRAVPRPIYTDPEIASVGLTEAEARQQYGDDVEVGRFPWVANARAVMQDATTGWVKSIHESRYGELLGLVLVGPHVTDLIEAGVTAIDAEATVETVADGMAAHPTLGEGVKEAGLVALGRAIHLPNRKRRAAA